MFIWSGTQACRWTDCGQREYYESEQLGALATSSFLSWQYMMQLETVKQNSNRSKCSSNSWPFFSCGYCESIMWSLYAFCAQEEIKFDKSSVSRIVCSSQTCYQLVLSYQSYLCAIHILTNYYQYNLNLLKTVYSVLQ